MAVKPTFAFSFSKKAEPKRVVESLAQKKDDGRQAITGVESGQVRVDGPTRVPGLLTIPCKNALGPQQGRQARAKSAPADPPREQPPGEGPPGGLLSRDLSALSAEDAEAARELLRDASSGGPAEEKKDVAPILMREAAKRVRDGNAPEASKEMFEAVPVESFGEALLRGMGYDPSKHDTKPVYRDKLRDTYLGLGAKALLPSEKLPGPKRAGAPAARAEPAAKGAAGPAAEQPAAVAAPAPAQGGTPAVGSKAPADQSVDVEAAGRPEKRRRAEVDEGPWASRGLVVRVIGRGEELREFFGSEAVVLEVDAAGRCRIKARVGGKSHVLQKVPLGSLETRVSRDCETVRIVRGAHKGTVAKLLQRDMKRGVARVRIQDSEAELPLENVCQFMA